MFRRAAVPQRLRTWLPPAGPGYELFDLASAFWIVVLASYAIAEPSPSTSVALQWLIGPTPLALWSVALNAAALGALICAFVPAAVRFGRGLVFAAASTWSAILFLGWLVDFGLYDAVALLEGVRMGAWFAVATLIATVLLQAGTRNKSWVRAVLVAVPAGLTVYVLVLVMTWSGDPRPFASAVIYGFIARTAFHQTQVECRPVHPLLEQWRRLG